jgi:hypothetical protein
MGAITVNVAPFLSSDENGRSDPLPPPLLGEHTREIATSLLGFDETEYSRLVREKIFY